MLDPGFREFAGRLAKEAGGVLMRHYGTAEPYQWKLSNDFVTQADLACDRFICEAIKKAFPEHSIFSEESGTSGSRSRYRWVVDPLDGTKVFSRKDLNGYFSVSIGLLEDGIPVAGAIYAPARDELYIAEAGGGAMMNSAPIQAATEADPNRVIVGFDIGKFESWRTIDIVKKLLTGDAPVMSVHCYGASAMTLAATARGLLDAYVVLTLELEDMAAAVVICREAGHRVTNGDGEEWSPGDRSIVVANPAIHRELMRRFAMR